MNVGKHDFFGTVLFLKLCKAIGCKQDVFCKGYCVHHYHNERRSKRLLLKCSEDSCQKKIWKSKFCRRHYEKSSDVKMCAIQGCELKSVRNRKCEKHMGDQPIFCTQTNCNLPAITFRSGLCAAHYHQERRILKKQEEDNVSNGNASKKKKTEEIIDPDI